MSFSGIVGSGIVLRCTWIALVFAWLLVPSGCWVTSIHPLYEDDFSSQDPDVVSDQSLIGSWMEVGGKHCAADDRSQGRSLRSAIDGQGGRGAATPVSPSHSRARLVKLDAYCFLDISPMAEDVCDMCIARHNILLAEFDKTSLTVTLIDAPRLLPGRIAGVPSGQATRHRGTGGTPQPGRPRSRRRWT